MKKILSKLFLLLVFTIVSGKLYSQNVTGTGTTNYIPKWTSSSAIGNSMMYETSSKIGIGTTSPDGILHLLSSSSINTDFIIEKADTKEGRLIWHNAGTQAGYISLDASENIYIKNETTDKDIIFNVKDGGVDTEVMRIDGDVSRVGIGTSAPSYKLQVDLGNILVRGDNNFGSANNEAVMYFGDANHYIKSVNGYGLKIGTYQAADVIKIVQGSGRVIIAGATQSGGSHDNSNTKLTVNGKIVAKEIYATTSNWADYVFNPDYKLLSLNEVEKFISINKHLPYVPSEAEIISNGNNLGETDAVLLRKIEELTLYIIEQNKRITELESKINNGK